jgi:hypothetical protein
LLACHSQAPAKTDAAATQPGATAQPPEPVASPPDEAASAPTAAPEASVAPSAAPPAEPAPAPAAEATDTEAEGHGRLSTVDRFEHVPSVRIGDIKLHSGEADPQLVKRVVRTMIGAQRLCYEHALKNKPSLEGNLLLRLTVNAEGTTTKVEKLGGTIADKDFTGCVQDHFSKMVLGIGRDLEIDVPISFAP